MTAMLGPIEVLIIGAFVLAIIGGIYVVLRILWNTNKIAKNTRPPQRDD